MADEESTRVCLETALRFACVANLDIRPILTAADRGRLSTEVLLKKMDDSARTAHIRSQAGSGTTTPEALHRPSMHRLHRSSTRSVPHIFRTDPSPDEHAAQGMDADGNMYGRGSHIKPIFSNEPIHLTLTRLCANSERGKPAEEYPKVGTPDPDHYYNMGGGSDSSGPVDTRYRTPREQAITASFDLVQSKRGVRPPRKQRQSATAWVRFRVPFWHPDYPYDVWKRRREPPRISGVIQLLKVERIRQSEERARNRLEGRGRGRRPSVVFRFGGSDEYRSDDDDGDDDLNQFSETWGSLASPTSEYSWTFDR